jgi:hypothetical protein
MERGAMSQQENGLFRITWNQVMAFLFSLTLAAAGWIYQGERARIERLEHATQVLIPTDVNSLRSEIAGVKADIAVLKSQNANLQLTLDRVERRLEAMSGLR